MNYCVSDIHGLKTKYDKIFDYVKYNDTLYILGDVIDRGKEGVQILKDIRNRKNVVQFIGNHELMMYNYLSKKLEGRIIEATKDKLIWTMDCNGGAVTLREIEKLSEDEIRVILNQIEESFLIKRIEVNENKFHLSHAFTISSVKGDLKFKDALEDERHLVTWGSIFPRHSDPFGKTIEDNGEIHILGHTPVQRIRNSFDDYEILAGRKDSKYINIDCGCAYGEEYGKLALLCLDTGETIYI